MLHRHRTFFHTGAAVQAVPDGRFGDGVIQNRLRFGMLRVARPLVADAHHMLFQIFHDVHGRQQLAGDVGRADIGAAPADGAGVAVQQLFPGEILHPAGPEPLGGFQIHRRQRPPRLQRPGKGVQRRRHHVHMLGKRNIDGEEQDDAQVRPPESGVQPDGGAFAQPPIAEQPPQRPADGHGRLRPAAALGHIESVGQQRRGHQSGHQPHHNQRIGVAGQVEAQPARAHHPAAQHRPQQYRQQHRRQDVEVAAVDADAGSGEQPFGEVAPGGGGEDEDGVRQQESQESPEDGGVADAGPVAERDALQDFLLAEDDNQRPRQPLPWAVEAPLGTPLRHQPHHAPVEHHAEHRQRRRQQQIHRRPNRQNLKIARRNHRAATPQKTPPPYPPSGKSRPAE